MASLQHHKLTARSYSVCSVFFCILKWYIVCTHQNCLNEAILMRTHNIPSCQRKSKRYTYFASRPGAMLTLSSSNYPCLEHVFMVPKMFEPLKFDCSRKYVDCLKFIMCKSNNNLLAKFQYLNSIFLKLDLL